MRLLDVFVRRTIVFASALAPPIACAAAGCTTSAEEVADWRTLPTDDASFTSASDDSGADAGSTDAGCSSGALSLIVTTQSTSIGSAPLRLFIPATYRASAAAFLLDTGSPYTFLHEPLRDGGEAPATVPTPDAGSVVLGCETLELDGYQVVDNPPVHGRPVVGTFGDDRLLARPVKLDIPSSQVLWNEPGTTFAEAASWPSSSYDRPRGYVRLNDVSLDGTPVQLLLDTGSPDSLWLGQDGKPGDREVEGQDSAGNSFKMYLGTVVVALGDFQETVPVYRVPSFPYVEGLAHALGGHMNGLFGLSAFRHGVVLDTDARRVRVAP